MKLSIDQYILELLPEHECVVVPDFGAFILHTHSARQEKETGKLLPPSGRISFNKKIVANDGLLIKHIADHQELSFQEATQAVKNFAVKINTDLKSKGKAHTCLGLFVLNNGQVQFFGESVFLPFSFGLEPFVFPKLKTQEEKVIELRKSSPATKQWMRYAAAIAGVSLITSSILFFKDDISAQYAKLFPSTNTVPRVYAPKERQIEKIIPEDSNYHIPIEAEKTLVIDGKTFYIAELKATKYNNHQQQKINKKYHIIAGCFRYKDNAQKLVKNLREQGLNAQIIDQENGLYRVAAESYSSRKKARWFLKQWRKKILPSAWLLVK